MDCVLAPAAANKDLVTRVLAEAGVEIVVRHDLPDDCTLFVCEDGVLNDVRAELEQYAWVATKSTSAVGFLVSEAQRGLPSIRLFDLLQ
jgi:hypothetical protein